MQRIVEVHLSATLPFAAIEAQSPVDLAGCEQHSLPAHQAATGMHQCGRQFVRQRCELKSGYVVHDAHMESYAADPLLD
ncbi:hypothetical protein LXT12_25470 [Pelomonas sp. P7]|uniref:Uncharacterized protein n=1 Tax=Pelomonas caseinilytica TaxID=2906763 RepID=A0ABS8XIB3_9BURK|nr:hypothetical protein [Pelomonas sp. P7]MCE4540594.1 hypothetical protein [Pelomonas sp. P7]